MALAVQKAVRHELAATALAQVGRKPVHLDANDTAPILLRLVDEPAADCHRLLVKVVERGERPGGKIGVGRDSHESYSLAPAQLHRPDVADEFLHRDRAADVARQLELSRIRLKMLLPECSRFLIPADKLLERDGRGHALLPAARKAARCPMSRR